MEWVERGGVFERETCVAAARGGHLHLLKWLQKKDGQYFRAWGSECGEFPLNIVVDGRAQTITVHIPSSESRRYLLKGRDSGYLAPILLISGGRRIVECKVTTRIMIV